MFGLVYKSNIDDLRESPSILIAKNIMTFHNGKVLCVEPNIQDNFGLEDLELVSFSEAEKRADIGVLLVEHKEFKDSGIPNIEIIIDTKAYGVRNDLLENYLCLAYFPANYKNI